jgi:energy-coupling factor transport system substrate-specific component
MVKKKTVSAVKLTALVGIMAATVECAKLALAALPNIEAVSLLLALFSYVFGWAGVLASVIFVCIEPLIWGMGPWFVSYLIYWPLLSLVFLFLGKIKLKNRFIITGIAVFLTFLFGVLTSLVDIGLFSGSYDRFFWRFGIYYARGIVFYVIHVSSNLVIFLFLFPPLSRLLKKIKYHSFK